MINKYDPRTKFFIVLCFSSVAVVFQNVTILLMIFVIELIYSLFLKAQPLVLIKRIRKILSLFIVLIIIQSLFVKSGNVLIGNEQIRLITDVGLAKGIGYLLRVLIILLSGAIIATSSMREIVQGLIQLKLPYDIAFMVSIGIKFLPLLVEQLNDTLIAIKLRGIDINKLSLKEKLNIYSYIFTPVIVSTLAKAKRIAIAVESRGFRAYDSHTSIRELKFMLHDYLLMFTSVLLTSGIVLISTF